MAVIKMHGAPDNYTLGDIGDFYVDIDTNTLYKCVAVQEDKVNYDNYITIYTRGTKNTTYTWEPVSGGSGIGFDFTILWDFKTDTGVTTGDYQDLYNKFTNREFVYGVIMLYSVYDVSTSYDAVRYFTTYNIEISEDSFLGLPLIAFNCDGGNRFGITSDNEVHYWDAG